MAYDLSCFEAKHGRPIGTAALGTFLSNRLYLHRLQPMYALNLVAGLDDQGRGGMDRKQTQIFLPSRTHTFLFLSLPPPQHHQAGALFIATTLLVLTIEWPPRAVAEGR